MQMVIPVLDCGHTWHGSPTDLFFTRLAAHRGWHHPRHLPCHQSFSQKLVGQNVPEEARETEFKNDVYACIHVFMYMCAYVYATEYTWQSEDNLCELVSTMWIPGHWAW